MHDDLVVLPQQGCPLADSQVQQRALGLGLDLQGLEFSSRRMLPFYQGLEAADLGG